MKYSALIYEMVIPAILLLVVSFSTTSARSFTRLELTDNHAFITSDEAEVLSLDISDINNIQFLNVTDLAAECDDFVIANNVLHMALGDSGYASYQVETNGNLSLLHTYSFPDYPTFNAREIAVLGDVAVLGSSSHMILLDISAEPQFLAYYQNIASTKSIVINSDIMYLASRVNGLRAVDISDPSNITEVGVESNRADDLYFDGEMIYAVANRGEAASFSTIDISDPSNMSQVGAHETYAGYDNEISYDAFAILNSYAYLVVTTSDRDGNMIYGIRVMDIQDLADPEPGDMISLLHEGNDLEIQDNHIFALTEVSLEVYNLNNPEVPELVSDFVSVDQSEKPSLPEEFSISNIYPNPFNSTTKVDFQLNQQSAVSYKLYNLNGQQIFSSSTANLNAGKHSFLINMPQISSGTYLFVLNSDLRSISEKIIYLR